MVWGANNYGQLGLGNYEDQYEPVRVPYFQQSVLALFGLLVVFIEICSSYNV